MFNWTKVLPNSFPLPIPFWDPLKFDQKVPHVFLLILNAHHTICFSVTYNMVLMLINLLVALSWHVEYTQCKALFCLIPKPAGFLEIIGSDRQKFAGHVLYAIGGRFNKPKNCGFPSVYQKLSFSDVSFVVSVFKESGLIKFKPQPGKIINFYSPIAKTKLSLISYLFHIVLEKCWK